MYHKKMLKMCIWQKSLFMTVAGDILNPVYNDARVFDVPQENVEDVYLAKVIDYDR